jgi:hypothetical protein
MFALVRAVLRGSLWCAEDTARGSSRLADMLAQPEYVAVPREIVAASLGITRDFGASRQQRSARPEAWAVRSFAPEVSGVTFPNKMHAVWMLNEMVRWGHLHPEANVRVIAERCCDTRAYRLAAAALDIPCPPEGEDFVPMELRGGRMLRLDDFRMARPDRSPAKVA